VSALPEVYEEPVEHTIPEAVFERIDTHRGVSAMKLLITNEAMLFVVMFSGYFFLSNGDPRWLSHEPPKLRFAIPMLIVLLTSSAILYFGERASKLKNDLVARICILVTILFGAGFLTLQVFEYREHLKEMTPFSSAYGSMFYTITSLHGLHVTVGLLMLLYVLFLPELEAEKESPHKALHNAGMYWHFVDTVWVFIVALLYVLPNIR